MDGGLLFIIVVFVVLPLTGWLWEQFDKYKKEQDKQEKSLQRDEIARQVLKSHNIPDTHIDQLPPIIDRIRTYLPRTDSQSKELKTSDPNWNAFLRNHFCPRCENGTKVKRRGPYGDFIGCSNYPTCNFRTSVEADKMAESKIKKEQRDSQKEFFSKEFLKDFKEAYK